MNDPVKEIMDATGWDRETAEAAAKENAEGGTPDVFEVGEDGVRRPRQSRSIFDSPAFTEE